MLESGWLFVGRVAFVWTLVTVLGAVLVEPTDKAGDWLVTVGGGVGFVVWGVWTFGSLDVEVVSGGTVVTLAHPELTILGVVMAIIPGYLALTGPIEMISRARDTHMEDL